MDRLFAPSYIQILLFRRDPSRRAESGKMVFVPSRLRQLFGRYAARHLKMRLPGFALQDDAGRIIGYLEEIEIWRDRLRVTGWVLAERVVLIAESGRDEAQPSQFRPDVVNARGLGAGGNVGFRLDIEYDGSAASFGVRIGQTRYLYPVPTPRPALRRVAQLRLLPPFLVALASAAPSALRWRLTRDVAHRRRVKECLGLTEARWSVPVVPHDMYRKAPAAGLEPPPPVTLIMPVYNAFDLLPEALGRIAKNTDLPWHLVLVEDASTDIRVRPFLREWRARCEACCPGRVTLIENPENLGFTGSVNLAFDNAMERGNHVVLLNSDALVPAGWASRLLRPILSQDRVASVTPMSNDAEIFSVPVICQARPLMPGQADAVDAVAAQLDPTLGLAEAPTGVGFCMAINIAYLRQEPHFDRVFGRGYGEEVDWCQKVRARGGRHLGTAELFVEHHGGSSFGSVEKQTLIARNHATIVRRYPDYDADVQSFIQRDPLAAQRLALALALAAESQEGPLPIYLAHSLDGGAEIYLCDRLMRDTAGGKAAVVLRAGGARRWQIELHAGAGPSCVATESFDMVKTLLDPVRSRRIVYSCGVGDRDPITIPERLLDLRRGPRDRLEILFHDFLPISPSYTLLNRAGVFRGVPEADDPDPAHQAHRPGGQVAPLSQWRAAWGAAISAADAAVVFSRDSAGHVTAAYPQARNKLVLRPHQYEPDLRSGQTCSTAGAQPVIGVLGNIGFQKGAKVIADLARAMGRADCGRLVLIGNIDPEYPLPGAVPVHGSYRVEDIPQLIVRYGITHWLIPSIWPETFSFTTREALATGLPVLCFDLGAQAEAVRAAPNGHIIPLGPDQAPATAALEFLSRFPGRKT